MDDDQAPAQPDRSSSRLSLMPKGRLEAFSDGVLAIVITIIVLELRTPPVADGETLLAELASDWRAFAGYLISFVFVGGVWVTHSTTTRLMQQTNSVLTRLNLVVLFLVSFIPFTTKLMAEHVAGPGDNVAVAIYGVNLLAASLALNAMIAYACNHDQLVVDDIADDELRGLIRSRRLLVVGQFIAAGVAIAAPTVAVATYLAISLLFIVEPLVRAHRARERHDGS